MVDENDGSLRVAEAGEPTEDTLRLLHRTIDGVRADFPAMHYNTAAAKLIELSNHLTKTYPDGGLPRSVAEPLVLMLSPLCPHLAEELWSLLGHPRSLAYAAFPVADESLLVEDTVEYPIQVNGKVRSRITVPASAGEDEVRARRPGRPEGRGTARGRRAAQGDRGPGPAGERRQVAPDRYRAQGPLPSNSSTAGALRSLGVRRQGIRPRRG